MATETKAWATRDKLNREDSATRAELVTAARAVFERRGYARSTIADVAGEAGVSRATFYVYFASKEDVFGVLAESLRDRFVAAQELTGLDVDDPYAVVEATTAAYLDVYTTNLAFITVLEHQSITDPAMYALWEEIQNLPLHRAARYIKRLARQGQADPAASPEAVSRAIGGMIANFAPMLAKAPDLRGEAVTDLTAMYLRLLGLPPTAGRSGRVQRKRRL